MAVAVRGECLLVVLVGFVWMRTRKDPVAGEGLFITAVLSSSSVKAVCIIM